MSATIRFLATDGEAELVLAWFRQHPGVTSQDDRADGKWFHFGTIGPPGPDPARSAVAYVIVPQKIRGALWTTGEVGFTASPLRQQFPELHATYRKLRRWFGGFRLVFDSRHPGESAWSYFLEGDIMNRGSDVYALPRASAALAEGQYFVPAGITEGALNNVCARLRLRGVACEVGAGGLTMQ